MGKELFELKFKWEKNYLNGNKSFEWENEWMIWIGKWNFNGIATWDLNKPFDTLINWLIDALIHFSF